MNGVGGAAAVRRDGVHGFDNFYVFAAAVALEKSLPARVLPLLVKAAMAWSHVWVTSYSASPW